MKKKPIIFIIFIILLLGTLFVCKYYREQKSISFGFYDPKIYGVVYQTGTKNKKIVSEWEEFFKNCKTEEGIPKIERKGDEYIMIHEKGKGIVWFDACVWYEGDKVIIDNSNNGLYSRIPIEEFKKLPRLKNSSK